MIDAPVDLMGLKSTASIKGMVEELLFRAHLPGIEEDTMSTLVIPSLQISTNQVGLIVERERDVEVQGLLHLRPTHTPLLSIGDLLVFSTVLVSKRVVGKLSEEVIVVENISLSAVKTDHLTGCRG